MEKDLQIRLLEELERAWLKCLPGRQAAARNELMRALPTELARKLAADFGRRRRRASSSSARAAAITPRWPPLGRQPL
jgi:hypothetical protein